MEMKNIQRTRGSIVRVLCFMLGIQATVGIVRPTEQPENTVAKLNENTTIKCIANKLVRWHVFVEDSTEEELWTGYEIIDTACPCSSCCYVDDQRSGKYSLNVNARKETAKSYKCTEAGSSDGLSATLIVIESPMTCTNSTDSSEVTLVCVLGIYGEWNPRITWSRSDGGQMNEANVSTENDKITSTLKITPPSGEVNYTAFLYFDATNRPGRLKAMNVPSYSDQWTWTSSQDSDGSHGTNSVTVGKIVLIVIGCALGVGLLLIAVWYIKTRKPVKESMSTTEGLRLQNV